MRERFHRAVVALAAACVVPGVGAVAQQTTATPKASAPRANPVRDEPVAIVNKRPVPLSGLINLLAKSQIPPGSEERAYESAQNRLVEIELLRQFLDETARVTVPAEELQKVEEDVRAELKKQGASLEGYLADTGTTIEEYRDRMAFERKWKDYVLQRATDKELKDYVARNKDFFSNAQVRASHILVKVEPTATAEEKEKARQKLLAIRQEIADKTITFADAANKYSEDEGNVAQPSGGDLGKFRRRGDYIEPFAKAAFALPKNQISDVVETEYGMHLILVNDRDEGQPLDFERARNAILNEYAGELQTELVEEMRKKSEIELKPMPKDLFQNIPRDEPAAAARGAAPAAGATTKPAG